MIDNHILVHLILRKSTIFSQPILSLQVIRFSLDSIVNLVVGVCLGY